jgi:hypothetical protein
MLREPLLFYFGKLHIVFILAHFAAYAFRLALVIVLDAPEGEGERDFEADFFCFYF